MKVIVFALLLGISFSIASGQPYRHPKNSDPEFLAETEHFIFFSHMWLNMHHFLYNQALSYAESGIEGVIAQDDWPNLSVDEGQRLETVLKFYSAKITQDDLRFGDYNYSFKRWVVRFGNDTALPVSNDFVDHVPLLNDFRAVYLAHFWAGHHESNRKVLDANLALIKKRENDFIQHLTHLCKARWQYEKIRVDISFNSKRDRPYTTTDPTTHIVMDSKRNHSPEGSWLELLLHEASHHLIEPSSGFVGGTISYVAEVMKGRSLRQLWHAYLFYFTGKVTQDLLKAEGIADYELYMVREQVFRDYLPFLQAHLSRYLTNEISLAEATQLIVEGFEEER